MRVVATPDSLDTLTSNTNGLILRIAADEALLLEPDHPALDDPYAIVEKDTGWWGVRVETPTMLEFLVSSASWELPPIRPVFVQGMVAGIAAKILVEDDRSLLLVPHAFAADMTERLPEGWAG